MRHHAQKHNSFDPQIRQVWSALKQLLFKNRRDTCNGRQTANVPGIQIYCAYRIYRYSENIETTDRTR